MHVSRNTTTKSSTGSGKSGFMTGRRRDVWGKRRVKSPRRVLPIKSSWKHLTTRWAWRVGGCGYVNFLNGGFFSGFNLRWTWRFKKKKKSLTTVYIQSWLHADVDLTFASTFTQLVAKTSHSCCLFASFFFLCFIWNERIYISVRCDTHASLCSALCSCYSSELLFSEWKRWPFCVFGYLGFPVPNSNQTKVCIQKSHGPTDPVVCLLDRGQATCHPAEFDTLAEETKCDSSSELELNFTHICAVI